MTIRTPARDYRIIALSKAIRHSGQKKGKGADALPFKFQLTLVRT